MHADVHSQKMYKVRTSTQPLFVSTSTLGLSNIPRVASHVFQRPRGARLCLSLLVCILIADTTLQDHFRKWGLRKNLSSQFVEDFLIRTRQQHSPPVPAQSPNGSVVVRNLNRRVNRYVRSGPPLPPDIELAHLLSNMNRPWYLRSPGNLGHAEQSSMPHFDLFPFSVVGLPVLGGC